MPNIIHDCGPRYIDREYHWAARVENPKQCPRCKRYLGAKLPKASGEPARMPIPGDCARQDATNAVSRR